MPRPRTFDEADVLERAVGLFRARGFERASIPELTAHLGICRQSLYNAFGDKRGLYLAALDRYGAQEIDTKLEMLASAESPLAGVRALVQSWGEVAEHCPTEGCLTVTAIIDSGDDDEARAIVESHVHRLEAGLIGALSRAQIAGEVDESASVERLGRSLVTTCYGIGVVGRLPSSGARVRDAVDDALARIDRIAVS